ncbi:hypothetical protein AO068_15335 [Pseudomonas sp. ICMP 3272]|uniref:Uncharacterized protein n=3 Tax=Pseudomonas TaxID=286 RepID=A0A3M4B0F7_9PSED|nr:hypothetical protein AO068_15335 [Pseudomonas sp. ICMP 3272]KTC51805.1 hypothetical protein AO258_16125 [Pseudomonas syringae ICMP 19498]RMP11984.1 hypothetical protein ALQ30_00461 [Pseudomonas syringae pv. persicae]
MIQRMDPAAFKAEYKRKGWTGRMLAERWQKSVAWISKIGNDPMREPHWDDAVRGLPDERLNYSSIYNLPWVEAWFNIATEDNPQRSNDMSDFMSMLDDFNKASTAEREIVDRVSVELWRYLGLGESFAWMAVKNQIQVEAANRNDAQGSVALAWLKAASDKRLTWKRTPHGDLQVIEAISQISDLMDLVHVLVNERPGKQHPMAALIERALASGLNGSRLQASIASAISQGHIIVTPDCGPKGMGVFQLGKVW